MTGAPQLLHVSDAHVAYGKVEAVRAVSLGVGKNEIVTIIGANGAGKTTLLNAVMGILPLKGRVTFAGPRPDGRAKTPDAGRAEPRARAAHR